MGSSSRSDAGSAMVEFVFLAVLLMVPAAYILLTVFRVQGASYAVSSATREAGRVFVAAGGGGPAGQAAQTAAGVVMADAGLAWAPEMLDLACSANPCLTPSARVTVSIRYAVALPWLPRLFDGRAPASVVVNGEHVQVVDRFRGG